MLISYSKGKLCTPLCHLLMRCIWSVRNLRFSTRRNCRQWAGCHYQQQREREPSHSLCALETQFKLCVVVFGISRHQSSRVHESEREARVYTSCTKLIQSSNWQSARDGERVSAAPPNERAAASSVLLTQSEMMRVRALLQAGKLPGAFNLGKKVCDVIFDQRCGFFESRNCNNFWSN
jgi:hypothetical protein